MADYNSSYTGAQIDAAVAKALAMPAFQGEVANFAALPGSPSSGDTYLVLGATGIWPFNRKPAGFYRYSGSAWVHMGWDIASLQMDSNWAIGDNADNTKLMQFELSGITTGTTRTLTVPDASGTIQLQPTEGAFANGDKTKLDGIETGADVTDTANVTAAGALMDSEVNNLSGIKTLTIPDSTTITAAAATVLDDATTSDMRTTLGLAIGSDVQAYDVDTAKKDVANEWTATQNFNATTLTDGASISWDLAANQVASVTLGGNRALANPTNMVDGGHYTLRVVQDGTGSRTLSYGTAYKWPGGTAPTLTTTASAVDILHFVSDGTSMYGTSALDFS